MSETLDARDARIKELEELLEQAKTILTEKNAKILDLQRNKGIDEMQERIKKLEEVKEWAFLVGGGSVYQEIFERVCFCSGCRCTENGNFDSGKHATGCDELNQRIQAVLEKGEA